MQTISYIEDNDYQYLGKEINDIIKVIYNDMSILITSRLYDVNDSYYYLIFVKESKESLNTISDFINIIETVTFNGEL